MLQLTGMNRGYFKEMLPFVAPAAISAILLGGLFAYAYVRVTARITTLSEDVNQLASRFASTTAALSVRTDHLAEDISRLGEKASGLTSTLSETGQRIEAAKKDIETVQTRVGGVEGTVGKISGTVDTLEKLSKTDPELLQKYSKVFFLNEHYAPERLVAIDTAYLYSERSPVTIQALVWPRLKELLDAAKKDNITLYIKSGYRSFKEQSAIKSAYTVTYGAGTANQFSADQGYSEHQLGTTVDFITVGLGGELDGFDKTQPYSWLLNNAHKYGFILSYPKNNAYYIFEPWHWRYVGVALATHLNRENKYFYDLDQREIDTYLANILD